MPVSSRERLPERMGVRVCNRRSSISASLLSFSIPLLLLVFVVALASIEGAIKAAKVHSGDASNSNGESTADTPAEKRSRLAALTSLAASLTSGNIASLASKRSSSTQHAPQPDHLNDPLAHCRIGRFFPLASVPRLQTQPYSLFRNLTHEAMIRSASEDEYFLDTRLSDGDNSGDDDSGGTAVLNPQRERVLPFIVEVDDEATFSYLHECVDEVVLLVYNIWDAKMLEYVRALQHVVRAAFEEDANEVWKPRNRVCEERTEDTEVANNSTHTEGGGTNGDGEGRVGRAGMRSTSASRKTGKSRSTYQWKEDALGSLAKWYRWNFTETSASQNHLPNRPFGVNDDEDSDDDAENDDRNPHHREYLYLPAMPFQGATSEAREPTTTTVASTVSGAESSRGSRHVIAMMRSTTLTIRSSNQPVANGPSPRVIFLQRGSSEIAQFHRSLVSLPAYRSSAPPVGSTTPLSSRAMMDFVFFSSMASFPVASVAPIDTLLQRSSAHSYVALLVRRSGRDSTWTSGRRSSADLHRSVWGKIRTRIQMTAPFFLLQDNNTALNQFSAWADVPNNAESAWWWPQCRDYAPVVKTIRGTNASARIRRSNSHLPRQPPPHQSVMTAAAHATPAELDLVYIIRRAWSGRRAGRYSMECSAVALSPAPDPHQQPTGPSWLRTDSPLNMWQREVGAPLVDAVEKLARHSGDVRRVTGKSLVHEWRRLRTRAVSCVRNGTSIKRVAPLDADRDKLQVPWLDRDAFIRFQQRQKEIEAVTRAAATLVVHLDSTDTNAPPSSAHTKISGEVTVCDAKYRGVVNQEAKRGSAALQRSSCASTSMERVYLAASAVEQRELVTHLRHVAQVATTRANKSGEGKPNAKRANFCEVVLISSIGDVRYVSLPPERLHELTLPYPLVESLFLADVRKTPHLAQDNRSTTALISSLDAARLLTSRQQSKLLLDLRKQIVRQQDPALNSVGRDPNAVRVSHEAHAVQSQLGTQSIGSPRAAFLRTWPSFVPPPLSSPPVTPPRESAAWETLPLPLIVQETEPPSLTSYALSTLEAAIFLFHDSSCGMCSSAIKAFNLLQRCWSVADQSGPSILRDDTLAPAKDPLDEDELLGSWAAPPYVNVYDTPNRTTSAVIAAAAAVVPLLGIDVSIVSQAHTHTVKPAVNATSERSASSSVEVRKLREAADSFAIREGINLRPPLLLLVNRTHAVATLSSPVYWGDAPESLMSVVEAFEFEREQRWVGGRRRGRERWMRRRACVNAAIDEEVSRRRRTFRRGVYQPESDESKFAGNGTNHSNVTPKDVIVGRTDQ